MRTIRGGMSLVAVLAVIVACGCAHQLTVRNMQDYRASGIVNLPAATTVGVIEDGGDKNTSLLVDGVASEMQRNGAKVVYPCAANGQPADVVAQITVKPVFKGSGANFFINFPGFLVWAPAWNGYVYKANFDIHVNLVKGSDRSVVLNSFDVPVNLDIRHAAIDRTWTEVSWFEVGAIALVGGIVFMQYDSDVTPLLMREIERPIGEYVAKKILTNVASLNSLSARGPAATSAAPLQLSCDVLGESGSHMVVSQNP